MKISDEAIATFLAEHPGWTQQGDHLRRSFSFPDYGEALGFVVRLGLVAEKRDHHPDVLLSWGRVLVDWSTHDAGGITAIDIEMAALTEQLYQ